MQPPMPPEELALRLSSSCANAGTGVIAVTTDKQPMARRKFKGIRQPRKRLLAQPAMSIACDGRSPADAVHGRAGRLPRGAVTANGWLAEQVCVSHSERHSASWLSTLGRYIGQPRSVAVTLDAKFQDCALAAAALGLYGVALFFTAIPSGASATAITEVTPSELHGRVSAVYCLAMSIVGLTMGPLSVALLTGHLFADPKRVGDSLALVSIVIAPLAAWLLWSSLAPFRRCMEGAR